MGWILSHIEKASSLEAENFFRKLYTPENSILTIAGNITPTRALRLVRKWFETIPAGTSKRELLPDEPEQKAARRLILERPVPANVIFKAWVVSHRSDPDFQAYDMLTDILSGGESGRLYTSLVRERRIFNEVNSYLTGETECGMLVIMGALANNITFEEAEEALLEELKKLKSELITEYEYEKVANRFESEFHLSHTSALSKATELAYFELLGDANSINLEVSKYKSVKRERILEISANRLIDERSSTLYYKAIKD